MELFALVVVAGPLAKALAERIRHSAPPAAAELAAPGTPRS